MGTKQQTTGDAMAGHDVVNEAGTPRRNHVFAVFDHASMALQAEKALEEKGIRSQRLQGTEDADALQSPDQSAGIVRKLERIVKFVGGESNEAKRYASHLEQGRIVLAIPAPDRDAALQARDVLIRYDAYDLTYFRDWAIEYLAPEANTRRGLPDHSETNTDA